MIIKAKYKTASETKDDFFVAYNDMTKTKTSQKKYKSENQYKDAEKSYLKANQYIYFS